MKLRPLIIGGGSMGLKQDMAFRRLGLRPTICKRDYRDHLDSHDFAVIATPTNTHIDIAKDCLEAGLHVMIEKPLDVEPRAQELYKYDRTIYVAYPLRFMDLPNRVVKFECKTNIYEWHEQRRPYSLAPETGGGAVFELSHEIDLSHYINGPIKSVEVVRSGIKENIVSNFECVLTHENYRMSILDVDLFSKSLNGRYLNYKRFLYGFEMYVKQAKYFLDNINNPLLMNNIKEAADVFKTIYEIEKQIRRGPSNGLLPRRF